MLRPVPFILYKTGFEIAVGPSSSQPISHTQKAAVADAVRQYRALLRKHVQQNVVFFYSPLSAFKDQSRDPHSGAPLLDDVEAPTTVTRGHFVVQGLQPGD